MSENVKPESLGERVAREFFPYDDETQRIDFGGIEAVRERLAEVVDRLSRPAPAPEAGRWRCEGCGEYVDPDPATDGTGHTVLRADGTPNLCGPVSQEPAPEAGIREAAEEREACYALIRSELDATEAALKNATGAFFEECLVARKVLQHAAEKIAARRLAAPAAPGKVGEAVTRIRNALVMLELGCSGFRDAHLLRKEVYAIQSALPEIEASLSRLGASGKAGWTKERPTKPGWYLHRIDGVPILMDVYVDPNLPNRVSVRWAEHSGGWGMSVDLDSIHVGEWSGPIPVPEE